MNTTSIPCPNEDNKCDNPMFKDFIGKNILIEMKPNSLLQKILINGLLEKVSGGYLCIKSFKRATVTYKKNSYHDEEYFKIVGVPNEYSSKDNESLILPKENINYIVAP